MKFDDFHTYREIMDQPNAFKRVLSGFETDDVENLFEFEKPERIVFVGCGTSYHIGIVMSFLINQLTPLSAIAIPGGEYLLYDFKFEKDKTLMFFISRSGETTEVVESLRKANSLGYETVGVSLYKSSTLIKEAKNVIVPDIGEEKSVVATKFYSGTLLSLMKFFTRVFDGEKIEAIKRNLNKTVEVAKSILEEKDKLRKIADNLVSYQHIVVLGMGQNFGAAMEASLKIKETSYIATEFFSTLEFRHGPKSMVNKNLKIIGLIPDSNRFEKEVSVLEEVAEMGGSTLLITDNRGYASEKIDIFRYPLINEYLTPITGIIPIHLLAFYRSVLTNKNPDKPEHLTKVVKIK
ncbi:MAG: SIS domain-containing protein [Candidatus Njordarchaeia archaeon]